MKVGERFKIQITGLSPQGEGTAIQADRTIYVPGAFMGESVLAQVEHVSRQKFQAQARVIKILTPHPARRTPPCSHQGKCSGCPWMGLAETNQRSHKLHLLQQNYGWQIDEIIAREQDNFAYRWSSKRVVLGAPGKLFLGSYMRRSHQGVDMKGCLIEHPLITKTFQELSEVANQCHITPYHEPSRQGDLRYVWCKTNGQETLLTLITASIQSQAAQRLASLLATPSGVAWSVQSEPGNGIRGSWVKPLRGEANIQLMLANTSVKIGPLGFLQPNPQIAELAYRDLVSSPNSHPLCGTLAIDLYAGAGITTVHLRRNFTKVLACDVYSEGEEELGIQAKPAELFLDELLASPQPTPIDLIVANPPRGGMGIKVCQKICATGALRLHIMSCHPQALATDLESLTGSKGVYVVDKIRAYDTLPQTPHLELVVWLRRR